MSPTEFERIFSAPRTPERDSAPGVPPRSEVPGPAEVLLLVERVSKHFGAIVALQEVTLWARRGEITAIVGDNGAGKSTLIKCISGLHAPSSGRLFFEGKEVHFASPQEARQAGIETVYQNLAVIEDLTVWQNIFLNRERVRRLGPFAVLDRRAMRREALRMLQQFEIHLPSIHARLRRLSGGQRQAIAIARAASWGSRLLIMDEPTAALGVRETRRVEELILRLREQGLAILLISHNFEQVLRLSQQVWVMRSGRVVGGRRTSETTSDELVAMITGVKSDE
ncbi:MAG: sugar ABC transporter ATP-binding protein [Thermogemmatispora sp.]|uniref:ATP-binding cassette domain-containing protein n=1 Tax=Thermogemmatispora sp. TaxID=1968838 RepID=UPI00260A5421|nr:ATP-binding cassette domain-containing protein [Thermogemmatispora sp.]MBX5458664.1 sugar ABC transporter ATP-binding protein [Thermogemmatispora sp.]